MLKKATYVIAVVAMSAIAAAQVKKSATVAEFVGTWNIEMMSHQVALVIEPAEGNKVTATLMAMGNDTALKGELVDGTLKLTGVKPAGSTASEVAVTAGSAQPGADAHRPQARPITAMLQEDGTLAGEMMTNQGAVKWTGEKLKKRK